MRIYRSRNGKLHQQEEGTDNLKLAKLQRLKRSPKRVEKLIKAFAHRFHKLSSKFWKKRRTVCHRCLLEQFQMGYDMVV